MDIQNNLDQLFLQDKYAKKCGCYIRNPHIHQINKQSPMMPLKNIDYQLEIVNSLMNISLSQRYFNPSDKFLEVTYSFPIAPNSSIYKFYAEFNDVRIDGVVKQKQEAKKQFEQAKEQGRQAVIGTIDPLSKDIMNLEIGNIPPKTEFVIYISFMQEMTLSMNTFYKTQIPSTISPRYASNYFEMLEKDKKEGKKSSEPDFTWTFKINLITKRKVIFFDSPSHDITLLSQNEIGTETLLAMTESCIPNKDFTFLYTTEDFHLPSYVLGKTDYSSTAMLSFIPRFCSLDINDAYKASVQNKETETDIDSARGDYIFLLDRSGSMGGNRIKKAKEALIMFLKSLPQDSYFNVFSFGSSRQKMFKDSIKYDTNSLQKAIKKIFPMGADLGGTQIYRPLQQIFRQKVNKGYPKHIFLLTDGGVSNTQGVLNLIKSKTKQCRVHSIGIGNGASFSLIQGSAQNGKGKFIMISDNQNPSDKIIELLQSTLTPLISDISLKYDQDIVESIVPNPKSLPYILKDELINFFVTFKGRMEKNTVFNFQYQDSVSKLPYKSQIQVSTESINQPFVDKMAHLKIIHTLEQAAKSGIDIEQHMMYVKVKDYKQEAIKQSIKHQVLSEYTAFLCVQKKLVDGKYQEFLQKGVEKVQVQQPKPIQYQIQKQQIQGFNAPQFDLAYGAPQLNLGTHVRKSKVKKSHMKKSQNIMSFAQKQSQGLQNIMFQAEQQLNIAQNKLHIDQINDLMDLQEEDLGQININQCLNKKMDLKRSGSMQSQQDEDDQIEKMLEGQFQIDQQMKKKQQENRKLQEIKKEQENKKLQQIKKEQEYRKLQEIKKEQENKRLQQIKKEQEKKKVVKTIKKGSIQKVVNMQNINGSWTSKQLIAQISNNPQRVQAIMKEIKAEIVITSIVCEWIQKYHNQKQYTLLVKKAKSWLKKALKEAIIQESKLQELKNYI